VIPYKRHPNTTKPPKPQASATAMLGSLGETAERPLTTWGEVSRPQDDKDTILEREMEQVLAGMPEASKDMEVDSAESFFLHPPRGATNPDRGAGSWPGRPLGRRLLPLSKRHPRSARAQQEVDSELAST
jgi:hypothetical protein